MGVREGVRKVFDWARSLDAKTVLILVLLVADAAHVGRLFAVREASDRAFVGYLLAFAIDGVLAVSLYEVAYTSKRSRRLFGLSIFLFACAVSAGFNVCYYREHAPADPWAISILLGATAPMLAAFLSILKALGDGERAEATHAEREAERLAELERYSIEQAEQTKRVQITEQERTKRERANARAERAKAKAIGQVKAQSSEHGNGRVKPGELDAAARLILLEQPNIGPRPLARALECSPSTAAGIIKRLNGNGHLAKAA